MSKVEMRLEIDTELVAQTAGVAFDDAADERARRWADENADAVSVHNARIADRGVFGQDLRRW